MKMLLSLLGPPAGLTEGIESVGTVEVFVVQNGQPSMRQKPRNVIATTRRFIDNFQPGAASPKAASIILVETATLLRTLSITKAFSLEERSTYRKLNYVAGYTASSPTERTHTILAPIDIFQRQRGITIECVAVFCALVYSSARLKLIWNIIC
jgi:hypothetical protein